MKTFKCVFLSSTQSGPNPFWKGALQMQNSNVCSCIVMLSKIIYAAHDGWYSQKGY